MVMLGRVRNRASARISGPPPLPSAKAGVPARASLGAVASAQPTRAIHTTAAAVAASLRAMWVINALRGVEKGGGNVHTARPVPSPAHAGKQPKPLPNVNLR